MKNIGWILVLLLGIIWAYLDIYGTHKIPIAQGIANDQLTPLNPLVQTIEAGYVPGKSPDAQKARAYIIDKLKSLPESGKVEIISQKILVTPRKDGTWTEEWVVKKGNAEIPIQIDFGLKNAN